MKADAIRIAAAAFANGGEPTDEQCGAAAGEAIELLLGFFADVRRIADANDRLVPFDDPARP